MKNEVFVQSPGLPPGGVFLQRIFKAFPGPQVQGGKALLSKRLIRKEAGVIPSEHPTSATCVTRAGQIPAGCTCSSAPGTWAYHVCLCCERGSSMLPWFSGRKNLLSAPGRPRLPHSLAVLIWPLHPAMPNDSQFLVCHEHPYHALLSLVGSSFFLSPP